MNPYLLAFSIYALLITPITLHVSVRVGRQVRYRLRVQAAGLPFLRKIKEPQPQEEHTVHEEDVARTLSEPWIWPALRAIGLKRLRRALHAVHLESAYLHVRFSFDDAAATALCYAALQTLLRTLDGRVEMDFRAEGTEVFTSGIIGARLGSLGMAAIQLGAVLLGARARRNRTEEETYAAASH